MRSQSYMGLQFHLVFNINIYIYINDSLSIPIIWGSGRVKLYDPNHDFNNDYKSKFNNNNNYYWRLSITLKTSKGSMFYRKIT